MNSPKLKHETMKRMRESKNPFNLYTCSSKASKNPLNVGNISCPKNFQGHKLSRTYIIHFLKPH
jgi:hypothetical protein